MGVYPFMFGYKQDFEPIVASMVQVKLSIGVWQCSRGRKSCARELTEQRCVPERHEGTV